MPGITVEVPPAEYRVDAAMTALWDATGALFALAKNKFSDDVVYTIILSRITRELRRDFGPDAAAAALHQYADTMLQAAQYDVQEGSDG